MAIIIADGKVFEINKAGFLVHLNDWIPPVALAMSAKDGLKLTDEHWEIIYLLREYFKAYQTIPSVRMLPKVVGKKLGKAKGNSKYLCDLFLYDPVKKITQYAGLPNITESLI